MVILWAAREDEKEGRGPRRKKNDNGLTLSHQVGVEPEDGQKQDRLRNDATYLGRLIRSFIGIIRSRRGMLRLGGIGEGEVRKRIHLVKGFM